MNVFHNDKVVLVHRVYMHFLKRLNPVYFLELFG
jgi:hypothetical protein